MVFVRRMKDTFLQSFAYGLSVDFSKSSIFKDCLSSTAFVNYCAELSSQG